jgi:hypothetical protein
VEKPDVEEPDVEEPDMEEPNVEEPNAEDSNIEDLELPTLPFPVAGPDKSIRRSKKTLQANRKELVGWAVEDVPSGRKWEFSEDTSWETFKKTLGLKECPWIWYDITGADRETILSAEDQFDTMRRLAISSWARSKEYVRIQFGDPTDFPDESET